MSTKIYYAYRFPMKGWLEVVDKLRTEGKRVAKEMLREKFVNLLDNPKAAERIADALKTGKDTISEWDVDHFLLSEFRAQVTDSRRSHYDFSASAALRFDGKYVYLIPYAGDAVHKLWDFLKDDPKTWGCEEYGYWNNTDRPDNVSSKEWGRRRRAWDQFLDDNKWWDFLLMEILTVENWSYVSPMWELMDERRKAKDAAEAEGATT